MKNILLLICLLCVVLFLWYFSFVLPTANTADFVIEDHILKINNWFSIVSMLAALFSLSLVVLKLESQKKHFEIISHQNSLNLEIMALSSLIQESDATLHRYDRWEAAGIKGDYVNAKSGVREKMNTYREVLESKFEEIHSSRLKND